jgi:hypothetical protein
LGEFVEILSLYGTQHEDVMAMEADDSHNMSHTSTGMSWP